MQLGEKIENAIARPLTLRMRPDLQTSSRFVRGQVRYVIKDPLTLAHHQLWEEEFALLQMLDGNRSFAEMKAHFEARFRPSRLDFSRLEVLLGQFHRQGLVLADRPGQAEQLLRRCAQARTSKLWSSFGNLLAIRFRGVNPDRMLSLCARRLGWFFSTYCLLTCLIFVLFTFAFVALQWKSWTPRLEELNAYLTPLNLIWLLVAFSGLKVLHELGHGLACKHFGGECNEIGVMLLAFAPCLYCDVSDSWMITSKWRRAFVAAAGMWFEMLAAAVCTWLWWFSHPGLIHSICFSAMLVGGLGTLFFNGNPLLRYDGYFVLSDVLESPNMWRRSRTAFWKLLEKLFLRSSSKAITEPANSSSLPLACYALTSMAYQWTLVIIILFFVYGLFRWMRLELIGICIIATILSAAATRPLTVIANLIRNPHRFRLGRMSTAIFLSLLGLTALAGIPLPASLTAPVLVHVFGARPVVVVVEGRLTHCVSEGTRVAEGDVVASLASADLQLELIARRGELERQRVRLMGLESRRGVEPLIANQITAAREAIFGLEIEVGRLANEVEQLILKAPCDGIVLAPKQLLSAVNENDIEAWTGTPLDPANRGCFLKRGVQVCQIGDPKSLEGTAYLTQSQVELVEPGQRTVTKLHQIPRHSFPGKVLEIGSTEQAELPAEIVRSGVFPEPIAGRPGSGSAEPVYVARFNLDSADVNVINNTLGRTRIEVHPQTLLFALWRLVYQTFRIEPKVSAPPIP